MNSAKKSARKIPASSSVRHQRQSAQRSTANSNLGEVGKMLGERWKALSEKQRAPYESKAAADKKRYEEEKAAYAAVCFDH